MANLTSVLTVRLIDAVSGPARAAAASLLGIGRAATAASGRGVVGIGAGLTRAADVAEKASKRMTAAAGAMRGISFPLLFGGAFAAKSVFEFEKLGNKIEAVGGVTKAQRKELEEFANVLSPLRGFTNTQIMQSALELSRAGLNFDQMLGALKGTLNLARAGDIELQESSDIATNVLTAMRLPMRTTEEIARSLSRVNDVLSFTANQSNADVRQLGETFKYVAPLAAAAGLSIEDVGAMAGVMANNGIKASEAGVAMRSALVRMVRPTREMSATLGRLGINLSDFVSAKPVTADHVISSLRAGGINAQGSRAAIDAALGDPALRRDQNALLARLTEIVGPGAGAMDSQVVADQIRDAINIAGSKIDLPGFIAALQRVGATVGDMARIFDQRQGGRLETLRVGAHNFTDFLRRLETEAKGSADKAADTMMQGSVGAWARFVASIQRLVQAIAQSGVLDTVTRMLDGMANVIGSLAKTNPTILQFGTYAAMIAAAAPGLLIAGGSVVKIVSWLLKLTGAAAGIAAGTAGIGAGTAAAVGAGAGTAAAAAAKRGVLRRVLGPLGLVLGGWELGREIDQRLGTEHFFFGAAPPLRGRAGKVGNDEAAARMRAIDERMKLPRSMAPLPGSSGPPSVPSVPLRADTAASSGAGSDAAHAFAEGLARELDSILPGVMKRAMDAASRNLSVSPSVNVVPRINGSSLQGVHGDVGVDTTR